MDDFSFCEVCANKKKVEKCNKCTNAGEFMQKFTCNKALKLGDSYEQKKAH